jgi:adenosylhomocysteine nucleosidase
LIVFAGFAGALSDRFHVGDMVLAEEIVDEHGNRWQATWPEKWPEECGMPLHRGRVLTVNRIIATSDDKHRLGEQHQACAVDMESAHFAARCTQAGVPFTCLRAISDEAATPLSPTLTSLLSAGSASPWRVLLTLARRPRMLPELLRLARDTKHASERLGLALGEMLMLV